MKMFSDCSGECCLCACAGFCLAGHGDDDYCPATKGQIIDRLNKGQYEQYRDMMIEHLRTVFGHVYDPEQFGCERQAPKFFNQDDHVPTEKHVLKLFGCVFEYE